MGRKTKSMVERYPHTRGPDGKNVCRYCHGEVPRPRIYWCSEECVSAAYLRCDPATQRRKVEERDRGVCAECGLDTLAVQAAFDAAERALRDTDPGDEGWRHWLSPAGRDELKAMRLRFRALGIQGSHGHLWEMDHIIPVAEGGDEIDDVLSNLRTLCVPCHKAASREYAAFRARAARRQQELALG